jgi:cytochrome c oxidase cbb3-type subunit 3
LLLACICCATRAIANDPSATAELHEQGRRIYNYRCYFCHGYSGDAKTLATTYLNPPPRDFTRTEPGDLSRKRMIDTVTTGKPGTAMHGFARVLNTQEIAGVVDFVRFEFIRDRRNNTRYHTPANGWPNHERYIKAFPFATGAIPLDTAWEQLTPQQSLGKQLFLTSCITCHDRARVNIEGEIWSKQSLSFPRNNYSHTVIDAVSSASIYAGHDIPPLVGHLSAEAEEGRHLWQQNCAFCHAADGTGENWIGSFLEPKPRNLTEPTFMREMTRGLLLQRIKYGLDNTSMPAWKDVLSEDQIQQIISYIDVAFHAIK